MAERSLSLELEAALPGLLKAVFSQPLDKTADSRLTVRPVLLRGERVFQVERQRGAQAFHENLSGEGLLRLCRGGAGRALSPGPACHRDGERAVQPQNQRAL